MFESKMITLDKDDYVVYKNGQYGDGPSNPLWGGRFGYLYGQIVLSGKTSCRVTWENNKSNVYSIKNLHKVINKGTPEEDHIELKGINIIKATEALELNIPKNRIKGLFNI